MKNKACVCCRCKNKDEDKLRDEQEMRFRVNVDILNSSIQTEDVRGILQQRGVSENTVRIAEIVLGEIRARLREHTLRQAFIDHANHVNSIGHID